MWRWDQQEPFGNNPANEDPDANSVAFDLPLRLPGQYFDKETRVAHNFLRDYSSDVGRYLQSDPIGFEGSLNTYLYVGGTPLSRIDPFGLQSFQCTKPLDSLGGKGSKSGPDIWGNPAYHQYSCVIDNYGQVTCGGQDRTGSALSSPGKPSNDKYDPKVCKATHDDRCFDTASRESGRSPVRVTGSPLAPIARSTTMTSIGVAGKNAV